MSSELVVQSISNTWLKEPVGKGPIYSNIGIDHTEYILQVQIHEFLYDQSFSCDYQWYGLQLDMFIVEKATNEIIRRYSSYLINN